MPPLCPVLYIRHVGQSAQQPDEAGTITISGLHVGTLQHGGASHVAGLHGQV